MQQSQYKDFSLLLHQRNWFLFKPNVCQFELTFACPLHCQHCYTDCYNNPKDLKKELSTNQALLILDKIYDSGVLWLCLTGGDPLARGDFLKIYTYAKKKGFIVTIFTSGALITEKLADYFQELIPFCIELTLNGVTKNTHETISRRRGSFKRVIQGINRLKIRKIPFKIKTLVTKQNYNELGEIKEFVENLGLEFRLSSMLHARLNQDTAPCNLRIEPEMVLEINERFNRDSIYEEELTNSKAKETQEPNYNLFRCAAGSDTFHVDPYGNMFFCSTVRRPSVNLLKDEISDGFKLFKQLKTERFESSSKCQDCSIQHLCYQCPGRAYLETGNKEKPLAYFCKLAHLCAKKENIL